MYICQLCVPGSCMMLELTVRPREITIHHDEHGRNRGGVASKLDCRPGGYISNRVRGENFLFSVVNMTT